MEVYYPQIEKLYMSEIRAMEILSRAMQHPNVVHTHEIIDDNGDHDKIIVVMEHCPGGQVVDWEPNTCSFVPSTSLVDETGALPEKFIRTFLW